MNHKTKLFKISDLFIIKYGVNLELCNCEECDKNDVDAVNFVSRTSMNNGVSGYVKRIDGIEPQSSGLITLAGGGSVLSTFLQTKPFYSGRDLYTLESITNISNECKLYIITLIKANRYRYAYGRQANKTFPNLEIELPIDDSNRIDWQFMEDYIKSLHYKPLTTKNNIIDVPNLNISDWKSFKLSDYFNPIRGIRLVESDRENGNIPLVTAGEFDNGVKQKISNATITRKNCITIDMFGNSFYQNNIFSFDDNIIALEDKLPLSKYTKLFLVSILRIDKYRYQYGRQYRLKNFNNQMIKLPATLNAHTNEYEPDWEYMENYIKTLPYGDRI